MKKSIFTYFQSMHHFGRNCLYGFHSETARLLDFSDFYDYGQEILKYHKYSSMLLTSKGIFVKSSQGVFFWFDPRCQHGKLWGVENGKDWAPGVIRCCEKILHQSGGTCLDIGANVGLFSITLAHKIPEIIFHAFEPIPDNYQVMEMNIQENGLAGRVVLKKLAISDQTAPIHLLVIGQLSHAIFDDVNTNFPVVEAEVTTVDAYCSQSKIQDVSLIKCDVEGFELNVLRGAKIILSSQKPALLIEIAPNYLERYKFTAHEIFSFLGDLGYSGRAVLDSGELGNIDLGEEQKIAQSENILFQHEIRAGEMNTNIW